MSELYYSCEGISLYLGKCEEVMATFADGLFDSCVTDPPYDLVSISRNGSQRVEGTGPYGRHREGTKGSGGFMGLDWDATGIAFRPETWQEVLRILKPGAHTLSFGGTRTYHRMACAIEDAGFECRDCVSWLYLQGFPKALDVAKAIDAMQGTLGEVIEEHGGTYGINKTRKEAGYRPGDVTPGVTRAPGSAEAEAWTGWKTAIKPAQELVCLARVPFKGSVASNVLRYGTGAVNIDGCRIAGDMDGVWGSSNETVDEDRVFNSSPKMHDYRSSKHDLGRYPANVIIDEFVAQVLDEQSGTLTSGDNPKSRKSDKTRNCYGKFDGHDCEQYRPANSGGASRCYKNIEYSGEELLNFCRFMYCPKASKSERNAGLDGLPLRQKVFNGKSAQSSKEMKGVEARFTTSPAANHHPTVKPIRLMRYLCRLITPPGGIVIDPFVGSGTSLIAALLEGFGGIGIDQDESYLEIAAKRIEYWRNNKEALRSSES